MNETEETVCEIIALCLQIKLFDQQLYADYFILTAESIQLRYLLAQKRSKNSIREEYDCINAAETPVNVAETPVNVTETPVNVTETTRNTTISAQIKLNNNKLNKQQQQRANVKCSEEKNLEKEREEWKNFPAACRKTSRKRPLRLMPPP